MASQDVVMAPPPLDEEEDEEEEELIVMELSELEDLDILSSCNNYSLIVTRSDSRRFRPAKKHLTAPHSYFRRVSTRSIRF